MQGCSGVINLVNNQDILANQIDLGAVIVDPAGSDHASPYRLSGRADGVSVLIERQDYGHNSNVGATRLFQERPQHSSWNEPTTTNSDDQVRLESFDFVSTFLTQAMHIVVGNVHLGGFDFWGVHIV